MKWIAASCVLAATLSVGAQPRDGGLQEQRAEEEASQCMSDPQCMALVRKQQAADARRQAEYEAKPWYDKITPWALLLGGGYVLYLWLGRPSPTTKAPVPQQPVPSPTAPAAISRRTIRFRCPACAGLNEVTVADGERVSLECRECNSSITYLGGTGARRA